jgi:hypothetical protein
LFSCLVRRPHKDDLESHVRLGKRHRLKKKEKSMIVLVTKFVVQLKSKTM